MAISPRTSPILSDSLSRSFMEQDCFCIFKCSRHIQQTHTEAHLGAVPCLEAGELRAFPELPGNFDLHLPGQNSVKGLCHPELQRSQGKTAFHFPCLCAGGGKGGRRSGAQCRPGNRVCYNAQQQQRSHFFLVFAFSRAKYKEPSTGGWTASWNLAVVNVMTGHGRSGSSQEERLVRYHLLQSSRPREGYFNDSSHHLLHFDYMRVPVLSVLSMLFHLIPPNGEIRYTHTMEFKMEPC